jgi:hypothetical protein
MLSFLPESMSSFEELHAFERRKHGSQNHSAGSLTKDVAFAARPRREYISSIQRLIVW